MGEHVVELARDPAALGDRRRPQLLLARVLELGEQQLGRVLARSRLPDEVGDQPEQRAQERRGDDGRRRAARQRRGEHEPRPSRRPRAYPEHAAVSGRPPSRPRRRLRGRSPRAAAARRARRRPPPSPRSPQPARATRPCDEAASDRESSEREHGERDRDSEPVAVGAGRGMAVDRPDHDRGDQRPARAAAACRAGGEAARGAGVRVRDPRGLSARAHAETIERRPARRNGPERAAS